MIVGIDPGLDGGIAAIDRDGRLIYAEPMPTLKHKSGRRYVSPVKLRPYVRTREIEVVGLEWVWAFPGEAASIAFGFGSAYGTVRGAFEVLHPTKLHTPQKWKKDYGIPGGDEGKDAARDLASEMWPDSAHLFTRKKDSGRADASLIADYQRRIEETGT